MRTVMSMRAIFIMIANMAAASLPVKTATSTSVIGTKGKSLAKVWLPTPMAQSIKVRL